MLTLDTDIARYRFECAKIDADAFQVVQFEGFEEISRLFRFELHLVSKDPNIDFAKVVNQPAVFTLMRGQDPVSICGIVTDLVQAGRSPDHYVFRAVLAPRMWRLLLYHQSRVFQHLTVEEIVTEVLLAAGFNKSVDFRFKITSPLMPREYCVQYQETDHAFVSRLLEHEGICYYFEHDGERDVLVMTDDRGSHPTIGGDEVILYQPPTGMVRDRETIHEAFYRERLVTEKVMLVDYNDQTPTTVPSGESEAIEGQQGLQYEYGNHFADDGAGKALAKIRKEEIDSRRRILEGRSDCIGLRSGYRFTLEGHYRDPVNQDYLITCVEHRGSQRRALGIAGVEEGDGADAPAYENTFTCIPASVQYRPERRTAKPHVGGLLTAKLETAGGPYAYVDDQGRYRFKNLFDVASTQPSQASLPARKVQQYSGPDYGIHFPDHAENEVVLAFENGDPDRPVIVGSMPNPSNTSPATSANRAQNVIRTWSKHELTFDDTQGSENIYLHSTKDWTIDIAHDKNQTVGRNESLLVQQNRDKTVGANQTESVGANKSIQVGGNHSETIGGNMTQNVAVAKAENVGAAKSLAIGGAYQVSVGAAMNESVGGAKTEEVGAFKGEVVGGNKSENVGGSRTLAVGKSLSITIGDSESVVIAKNLDERVGGKHSEQVAKEFAVSAQKIQLLAKDEIVLKTGSAQIIMKKNGDIVIKGKKIQVKGSGDVVIKGSQIKEN